MLQNKINYKFNPTAQLRNPNRRFDDDKTKKEFWDLPENQFAGFQEFEGLLIELKEDYHKASEDLSE